jgi:hypothetical protein
MGTKMKGLQGLQGLKRLKELKPKVPLPGWVRGGFFDYEQQ